MHFQSLSKSLFCALALSVSVATPYTIFAQCSLPNPTVTGLQTVSCTDVTTLSASGSGSSFLWYDQPSGGRPLFTGPSFTTPSIGGNDTFYVQNVNFNSASQTFNYTGGQQSWVVPNGVYSVTVDMAGAQGGNSSFNQGGRGGRVQATLSVTPGQTLFIYVGQQPTNYLGGWNGGGSVSSSSANSRGGGGATDIRIGGTSLNERVLVAGGGGGALYRSSSSSTSYNGGPGGGLIGGVGGTYGSTIYRGDGGTQLTGGSSGFSTGSFGQGGTGRYNSTTYAAGGGGGGWYGGGGGNGTSTTNWGSGGGGSNYAHPTLVGNETHTQGFRTGHGYVSISWQEISCQSNIVSYAVASNPLSNPIVTNDSVYCGNAGILKATGSTSTFKWYTQPIGGLPFSLDSMPQVLNTQTTTYYVEATNTNTPNFSTTFNYNGSMQMFVVPSEIYELDIDMGGAQGGSTSFNSGGLGGRVQTRLRVTPGQTLYLYVGEQPGSYLGGWNGGGGVSSSSSNSRGGGGATDIRVGGTSVSDRVLVAGGGGGAMYSSSSGSSNFQGGHGGGLTGSVGGFTGTTGFYVGEGGTQTNGGYSAYSSGSFGFGGTGFYSSTTYAGGGGGGGWYGGGGGHGTSSTDWASGGGGSSYTHPTLAYNATHTQGFRTGHGYITISYTKAVCASQRIPVQLIVDTVVPLPIANDENIICGLTANLTASGSTGFFNWYTQPTGGGIIHNGNTINSGIITTPTTFYVEATSVATGPYCVSPRVPVLVNTLPVPDPIVTSDSVYCGNTGTLMAQGSVHQFNWYTTPSGGSPFSQDSSINVTDLLTTTYYVEAITNYNPPHCRSNRVPVNLNVDTVVPLPIVNNINITCGYTASLTASGTTGYFNWYTQPSGGLILHTGNTLNTTILTNQTTYYVEASSIANPPYCVSARVPVVVTTDPVPVPTVTVDSVYCGNTGTLWAGGTTHQFKWYTTPSGGSPFSLDSFVNVMNLTTTTYYVEATTQNYPNGAVNFNYTGGVQTWTVPNDVYSINIDMAGAQGGNTPYNQGGLGGRVQTTMNVTPGQVLHLYIGGQPTNYLGGWNGGGSVNNASANSRGGGGATDIRIGGTSLNDRIVVAGGGGGALYRSTNGSSSYFGGHGGGLTAAMGGAYGSTAYSGGGGTQVSGGSSGFSTGSFGQGGTGQYSSTTYAAGGGGGGWYGGGGGYGTSSTNWGSGGGGSSYSHPILTNGTTHTQGFRSGHGYINISYSIPLCISQRVPVDLVVDTVVPLPVTNDQSIICGLTTKLGATASTGFFNWYTQPSGGSIIHVGDSLFTGILTAPTTFYVEASSIANAPYCVSQRVPVLVNTTPVPDPLVTSDSVYCGNTGTLMAQGSVHKFNWYTAPSGGSPFSQDSSINVTDLQTTTYYVEAITNYNPPHCRSNRVPVNLNVDTVVPLPIVTNVNVTCGLTTKLAANGTTGYFNWYTQPTGGNILYTGDTLNTTILTNQTTYYVEASSIANPPYCVSARVPVVVTTTPVPNPIVTPDSVYCGNTGTLIAQGSVQKFNWYTTPSGGSPISQDSSIQITDLSTTTYYVEATTQHTPNGGASFGYTGGVQSWTVPSGVYSINIDMAGAQGGNTPYNQGGLGGRVQTTMNVTPGQVLNLYIGGQPTNYLGGWNGGGSVNNASANSRGGGGATDIRIGGTSLNDRIVVAGGGGGALYRSTNGSSSYFGGHGGGLTAAMGGAYGSTAYSGGGGTQVSGGSSGFSTGSFGQGGTGQYSSTTYAAGGGGGGWYGGGGGYGTSSTNWGSGGGGSSYSHPTITNGTTHTQGFRSGHGYINISYSIPFCLSQRIPVDLVVDTVVPIPIVSGVNTICGTTANVQATGSTNYFNWYTQPSGGSIIHTGTTLNTGILTAPATFYVEASSIANPPYCVSARQPVFVNITPVPLPTVTPDTAFCGVNGTLKAQGSVHKFNWYTQASGGSIFSQDSSLNVTDLSTRTYYVEAISNYNPPNCRSPRVPVTFVVNPLTSPVTQNDTVSCGQGSLLTVGGSTGSYYWFTQPSGGSFISQGSSLSVPPSYTPTTYYVEAYNPSITVCRSLRIPIQILVDSLPAPTVSGNASFCSQGNTIFTASGSSNAYQWFDAPNGNLLGSGNNFATGNQTASQNYYVRYDSLGCVSQYAQGTITINPTPDASILTNRTFCSFESPSTLQAASPGGIWYGTSAITDTVLGLFNPSLAQIGNNQIVYAIADPFCPSSDTIALTVIAGPDATIQPQSAICSNINLVGLQANSSGGSWSGNGITNAFTGTFNPSNAGVGNHIISYAISQSGCTDTDTILITVKAAPDALITSSSSTLCSSQSPVQLNSLFPGGVWSGSGITDTINGIFTPASANLGNNTVSYAITQNGCTDTKQLNILINPSPNATILSNPNAICSNGQPFNLFAQNSGGFWSGTGITNASNGEFNPAVAGIGQHAVSYSIYSNGCSDADTVQLFVNAAPNVSITPNTAQAVCEGNSVQLSGTGVGTYQWLNNGNAIGGASSANFTPTATGNYQIQVTNSNNCTAISTMVPVTLSPKPVIYAINGNDVCEGSPIQFTQISNVSSSNNTIITGFDWDYGDATTGIGYQSSHTYSAPGSYNVQLIVRTNYNCTDTLYSTVHVNPNPTINSVTVNNVCFPSPVVFNHNSSLPVGSSSTISGYVWNFGDNYTSSIPNTSHAYLNPGQYYYSLRVLTNKGCSADTTGIVNVDALPTGQFFATAACSGTSTQFTDISAVPNGTITNWLWNFGDGVGASQQQNPTYNYANSGTYPVSLTVTTSGGCSNTINQVVTVNNSPNAGWSTQLLGTNTVGFSPNAIDPLATYTWEFEDGSIYSQANISKTFPIAGDYQVCLTVTKNGCSTTSCSQVSIGITSVEDQTLQSWNMYPNPTQNDVTISTTLTNSADVKVMLFDLTGKLIYAHNEPSVQSGEYVHQLPLSQMGVAAGSYIVRLFVNNEVYTNRIIKLNP